MRNTYQKSGHIYRCMNIAIYISPVFLNKASYYSAPRHNLGNEFFSNVTEILNMSLLMFN